jgi:hypothetical protein
MQTHEYPLTGRQQHFPTFYHELWVIETAQWRILQRVIQHKRKPEERLLFFEGLPEIFVRISDRRAYESDRPYYRKLIAARVWHKTAQLLKTLTLNLSQEDRHLKQKLLGKVDILRSGIANPSLTYTIVGTPERQENGSWKLRYVDDCIHEEITLTDAQIAQLKSDGWREDRPESGYVTAVLAVEETVFLGVQSVKWTRPLLPGEREHFTKRSSREADLRLATRDRILASLGDYNHVFECASATKTVVTSGDVKITIELAVQREDTPTQS